MDMTEEMMAGAQRLKQLGRCASALSGDDEIEKSTAKTAQKIEEDASFFLATTEQIQRMSADIAARRKLEESASDGSLTNEQADALIIQLDEAKGQLANAKDDALRTLVDEERRVRKILAEHDYIQRLLAGAGSATDKQFSVMAFPRGANTKTNVLQISGGAGTGKTLCLLAKLIQDTRPSRQMGLLTVDDAPRKGLFVCYNLALKNHVKSLLNRVSDAGCDIEVVSFDQFLNQLVRAHPDEEYAHLRGFASSSRYPDGTWRIKYGGDVLQAVADAMAQVAGMHPDQAGEYYLNVAEPENVEWVLDEIAWLEARYADPGEAHVHYPEASRVGRGASRRPSAAIRRIILQVWDRFRQILEDRHFYTIEQATKRLLDDPDLPKYDAIAIDEVQDLTVASIKLLVRMRASDSSRVYICGDENQKIYKRDFTWAELDEGVRGHTIRLEENHRNSPAIEAFAGRLLGVPASKDEASEGIYVGRWDEASVMGLVDNLLRSFPNESVALIGSDLRPWYGATKMQGVHATSPKANGAADPGFYMIGDRAGKGLEFDTVIIDLAGMREEEEQTLRNILYVNCTRARHRLYVRFTDEPPELLTRTYPDFLPLS
ncbi:MAG: ATP-binding domain-containing protein [Eggerthellaceae bacterium]|nr:ATP-binding domain-containing protein [Eggerthellaceae bacterium]